MVKLDLQDCSYRNRKKCKRTGRSCADSSNTNGAKMLQYSCKRGSYCHHSVKHHDIHGCCKKEIRKQRFEAALTITIGYDTMVVIHLLLCVVSAADSWSMLIFIAT